MSVTVTLPTLGDNIRSLGMTIDSLATQTFKDFTLILILPRGYQRYDEIEHMIDRRQLKYKMVEQDGNGFENAMNTAFRNSGNINVNTDDDALYPKDHLNKCLSALERPKIGLVSGLVNGKLPFRNRTMYLLMLNRLVNPDHLVSGTEHYLTYFNSSGLLAVSLGYLTRKRANQSPFMSPIGVNMAWKNEAVEGFRLLEFSKKAILNESYLAFHAFRRGYNVILDNEIHVVHNRVSSASLSSSKSEYDDYVKLTEFMFSPLIIGNSELVDLGSLRKATNRIRHFLPRSSLKQYILIILDKVVDGLEGGIELNSVIDLYNRTIECFPGYLVR